MHARLAASRRRTHDPASAHLFVIPFYSWQFGHKSSFDNYRSCGVDFASYQDPARRLWQWLLEQPSFQNSNCSDHFVVLAEVAVFKGKVSYKWL